jgi:DNA-directed RNA polymerase subunit H (RpoH/RPB5)
MSSSGKSFIIYNNLFDGFFKYRHVEPVSKRLDNKEFHNQMNHEKVVFIITKVSEEYKKEEYEYLHIRPLYIILLSEFNDSSTRLTYLTGRADKIRKMGKDKNPEIIIIANKQKTPVLSEGLRKKDIYMYEYVHFAIIFPECSQAELHEIMKPEEVKELLERFRMTTPHKLTKIVRDDTMVIWIGAKPGDLLRIKMMSEMTINTYCYRLVRNATLNYGDVAASSS